MDKEGGDRHYSSQVVPRVVTLIGVNVVVIMIIILLGAHLKLMEHYGYGEVIDMED